LGPEFKFQQQKERGVGKEGRKDGRKLFLYPLIKFNTIS
jgi:hypothetical protein